MQSNQALTETLRNPPWAQQCKLQDMDRGRCGEMRRWGRLHRWGGHGGGGGTKTVALRKRPGRSETGGCGGLRAILADTQRKKVGWRYGFGSSVLRGITARPVEGLRQALPGCLVEGWRHLSEPRVHRYSTGR